MKYERHLTFVDVLQERAKSDRKAYTFWEEGGKKRRDLGYHDLHQSAMAIASKLQETQKPGDRILLLYSSSCEFIKAFFGCLYAGVVAVPAYPPHPQMMNRMLPRILTVIRESDASMVLSDSAVFSDMKSVRQLMPELKSMPWFQSDHLDLNLASQWKNPKTAPDQLGLIQFTSGSTGTPKGVMITQGNLVHNCHLLQSCGMTSDDIGVSWTPVYHDMGLIFGMLCPIYCGFPMNVMSPIDFLMKPIRWLQEISDIRATITCAPNFAFDLCSRKVKDEELAKLDLSCLTAAVVSAEPVRAESLQRFSEKFSACGFSPNAFHPAYGMAESTLVICSDGPRLKPVPILDVEKAALEENRVDESKWTPGLRTKVVSSGRAIGEMKVEIVDPNTGTKMTDGNIGEIWVSGPSIAKGYWKLPEETERDFNAFIHDTGEGPFLRTGDLGFLKNDEVFVTGRLKDVIIVRGRNFYPQDIERSVELAEAPIRQGCVAAFAIEEDGEEKVVVVAEVERRYKITNPENLAKAVQLRVLSVMPGFDPNAPIEFDAVAAVKNIRKQVLETNEVTLHAVVLIAAGSIPKTSSGKIRRRATREAFLKNELTVVQIWQEEIKKLDAA